MRKAANHTIVMIPVARIHVLNPRVRNQKIFKEISTNIMQVGLKRPITVTRSVSQMPGKDYDLVCGQGRLEAFIAHEQKKIPAIVVDASGEQALIMSLVENLARRQHRAWDLLEAIEILHKKGYDAKSIAAKTGLTVEYSYAVLSLLNRGEQRLLIAVENGQIPVSVAIRIADSPGDEQLALQEAYESNLLRGSKLVAAKRLIEIRKRAGKTLDGRRGRRGAPQAVSAQDVLRIYRKEVDRKKLIARKAGIVSARLLFITEALKSLLAEENFVTLLRAENLTTMPKQLNAMLTTISSR